MVVLSDATFAVTDGSSTGAGLDAWHYIIFKLDCASKAVSFETLAS